MDFKNILLIACLFVGLNTVAQNRLEFNQVLNISSNTTNNSIDTVPQNKVWKITGYSRSISGNSGAKPILNGVSLEEMTVPYWLKEGGVIGTWTYNSSYFYSFNIIEFNIVQ